MCYLICRIETEGKAIQAGQRNVFAELVASYSASWAVVPCSCEARHDLDLLADWLEAGRLDRGLTQLKVCLASASRWYGV